MASRVPILSASSPRARYSRPSACVPRLYTPKTRRSRLLRVAPYPRPSRLLHAFDQAVIGCGLPEAGAVDEPVASGCSSPRNGQERVINTCLSPPPIFPFFALDNYLLTMVSLFRCYSGKATCQMLSWHGCHTSSTFLTSLDRRSLLVIRTSAA